MKCDEIKTLLNPYVDNELTQTDAERVRKHLAECSLCAKEVADLQKIKNMLHKLPSLTAPAGLLEGVRDNLARPHPEVLQRSNAFLRYRWLTLSLASAAAVILVAFTLMIQFRKSDMPSPELANRYAEKSKANLGAPAIVKTEVADAIQTHPMLFTQQINISAFDVDDAVAKVYAVASAQTPDIRLKAEYQRKQVSQEKLLAQVLVEKRIQNENQTVSNSVAPLREQKSQVVKISIPLSQKDAFVKQLQGNISNKLVLAEMQTIYPAKQQDGLLAGYLADAKKAIAEHEEMQKENELADKNTNTYDAAGKGGERGLVSKKPGANKIEGDTSGKAKGEESKNGSIVTTGSIKEYKESPKDELVEKPKSLPTTTTAAPPPPPGAPAPSAPPPPGGFGQALAKKDISRNDGMKEQADADDEKNALSKLSRVDPEPMIEFTIVIDQSGK